MPSTSATDLPFDALPLNSASLDDLDLNLFQKTYLPAVLTPEAPATNEQSVEHQLAGRGFATVDGTPTVAGMITVGREPSRFVPGAYVQFLRIDGQQLSDQILDAHKIVGPLPDVVRELDALLRINIRTAVDLTSGPVEKRQADYPFLALQQLTRNALMHRIYEISNAPVRVTWFTDRVEIQNPGALYGTVTVENFGTSGVTDYRNPTLAEAMRQLGYVRHLGLGIQTARNALADNGNPEPDFCLESTHVTVIISPA
jgi:ATP-dependent DNA helicase RecG